MILLLVQLILQLTEIPLQLPFSVSQLSGFALQEQENNMCSANSQKSEIVLGEHEESD